MQTLARINFGVQGNSLPHLLHGFSAPENGATWSVGDHCALLLDLGPLPSLDAEYLLELDLTPFFVPDSKAGQRLTVSINGVEVGRDRLFSDGTSSYRIPGRALRPDGRLHMDLQHPDAHSPASVGLGGDTRVLAFMHRNITVNRRPPRRCADLTVLPPYPVPLPRDQMGAAVTAATGLDPHRLVLCFESLGLNCEFGMLQKHVGAEPLGLLRFAGITLPHLLGGLRDGFAGVGDQVVVRPWPIADGRQEFLVHDDRYNISLHSFRTTDETTAEAVRAEHGQRLRFMRRRFTTLLKGGQRLFVVQRPGRIALSQARPILHQLQSFGPNALLYVDGSPDLPSGAVAQMEHGLFHGKLDRMAPAYDAGDTDLAGWLSLCVNAYRLWKAAPWHTVS